MKIFLETMGCQMNRLDSELLIGHLCSAGHEMVPDRNAAEVVLFNTCSVRAHAEDKVYSRIGEEGVRKSPRVVGVLGCMAQREGAALAKRYPQVDIVCGPGQLERLPDLIAQAAAGRSGVAIDPDRKTRPKGDTLPIDTLDLARNVDLAPSRTQAFVRVMRGCDKFCAYCIVPFVRGPEISRDPQHIFEEVSRLVEAGRSEITLLGQTVNSYRWTSGERTTRFSDLLELLSPITGLRRLRFVTSHPIDFGDDILHAIADLPNVCEYIHCPAQSGSDAVLKQMNRKYTRGEYDAFIDRARTIIPGVVILSDFIVGFPGESEADHDASADLIVRGQFKNSFIFKYSPRPGTPAAKRLDDDVPDAIKRKRNNHLLAIQAEVGLAHHQQYVGRTIGVLVTGKSRRSDKQPDVAERNGLQLAGRSRGDHIVVFNGPESLIGEYVDIEIINASALTLFGMSIGQ